MRKTFLVVLLIPAAAGAQTDSTARGEVGGAIYDSIARAPLPQAVVQMMDPAHPERLRSVTADAKGRYVFMAVAAGRYLIGFQHPRLDSLALDMPTRAVDVRAGERAKTDLAIPSAASINAVVCGSTGAADSTGLVIGMLRDATTGEVLTTGAVQGGWQELTLERGQFVPNNQFVSAVVQPTGWFALCGVPADVDVLGRAFRGRDSTGMVTLRVPVAGIARHDFVIGGVATVHGAVLSERGKPLVNARIVVAGTERGTYTDSAGAYRLGDIAAGSQTLEVRALGYVPEMRELDLGADRDTALTVTLTSLKQVLDTIHIVATRLFNRDTYGFEKRKKMGFGTFLDEATIARRRPFDVYSLLQALPSVHVVNGGFGRAVVMSGPRGVCSPSLFLDGMRMPKDVLDQLDVLVRTDELGGMEVYRSGNVPGEFWTFDECGAIVIWTKTPLPKPKPD